MMLMLVIQIFIGILFSVPYSVVPTEIFGIDIIDNNILLWIFRFGDYYISVIQ